MEKYKTVRLCDVCEQISGEWGQDCLEGNGTKVLRTTNFTNIGIVQYDDVVERLIPQNKIDSKHLKKGDIILEKSGGSDTQPVGRVVYFDRDDDIFLCNNFTTALRISDNSVFSKYVFDYMFYMHKVGITEYYQNKTTGIRNLQTKAYLDRKILLPPIKEQKHIAAVLDKCTELIAKNKQMLEKYDTLIKSRFIEMFGDPIANPMEWDSCKLDELADIVSGITKGRKTKETTLIEVPYMAVSNVKAGYIDWTTLKTIEATKSEIEMYRLKENDVLMAEGGDPDKVGRGALLTHVPDNCIHQNHVFRVRLFDMNPIYFSQYLQHSKSKKYFLSCAKQTTGIASINMTQLKNLPVNVPPIELQNDFASFVQQIDGIKSAVQKSLGKAETLYKSLMQQYFG